MARSMTNRFDVQVAFPDITFGIKNRADVELTPEQVADELEKFCRRIRESTIGSHMTRPRVAPAETAPRTGARR